MTTSVITELVAHNIWATQVLIDACAALTDEQLRTPAPGTYGSIIHTFRHLVGADGWFLSFFRETPAPIEEDGDQSLAELRVAMTTNGAAWLELLAADPDPDKDTVEHGEGWDFHAPVSLRLAQVAHHGTDHRSQICTALTSFGIEPPGIDLWNYGEANDRTRAVRL